MSEPSTSKKSKKDKRPAEAVEDPEEVPVNKNKRHRKEKREYLEASCPTRANQPTAWDTDDIDQ